MTKFLESATQSEEIIREALRDFMTEAGANEADIVIMVIHGSDPVVMAVPAPNGSYAALVHGIRAVASRIELATAAEKIH